MRTRLVANLRNPRVSIPIGTVLLGAVVFGIHVRLQVFPNEDLLFYQNVTLAAFTGLLGASIGMWIQSRLARENQDYRFRQEVEAKHFEDIYGPLYDETRAAAEYLDNLWSANLTKWREIRAGRYGLFVPAELASYLDALDNKCNRLIELRVQVNADLKRKVGALVEERWHKAPNSGLPTQIESYVQQDGPFLYVPTSDAQTSTVSQIWEIVKINASATKEDVEAFLRDLKKELGSSQAVEAYHRECLETSKYARWLHDVIGKRMVSPFKFA